MDLKGKLRQGMRIFGHDDRDYGTIDRYDDQYVYVGGRRIPHTAFERSDNDRLYVGQSGLQYFTERSGAGTEGHIRVPEVEERLDVEKRQGQMGEVAIHKSVTEEQVSVPVELTREEVHVERVDTHERPIAVGDADAAFKEETIRVPVRGEEAYATKEAVVTGEVVIDKERTTERQTVTDTVRKQHVEVDEDYQRARSGFMQHFQGRQGAGSRVDTRTFDDAEPNYRRGFEAGYDERYRGREFADVEPDLRRDYEGRATGRGDSWEHLREEIREGWNRARGR